MESEKQWGIAIYQKDRKEQQVLKDLLQFLRFKAAGKPTSFAYIEAESSLLPNISLWENLQLATGGDSWEEYTESVPSEWRPLTILIKNPDRLTSECEFWEKFTISLLKGLLVTNKSLLIDMNENLLSPLMIQNYKKIFLKATENREIILATANTAIWLDCAHSLVTRVAYEFNTEELGSESIKRHWVA